MSRIRERVNRGGSPFWQKWQDPPTMLGADVGAAHQGFSGPAPPQNWNFNANGINRGVHNRMPLDKRVNLVPWWFLGDLVAGLGVLNVRIERFCQPKSQPMALFQANRSRTQVPGALACKQNGGP